MIDGPDTHGELSEQPLNLSVPLPAVNPLETTEVQCGRSLPAKLTEGEVFLFDDLSSLSTIMKRLLAATTELTADQITIVNPKDVFNETIASQRRVQDALTASIAPVVQAAQDPAKGVSLVITDFEMGAITGETLLQALQEALGEELPFRVILHSGNPELATESDCFRDAFMEKPLDIRKFKQLLDALFPE